MYSERKKMKSRLPNMPRLATAMSPSGLARSEAAVLRLARIRLTCS